MRTSAFVTLAASVLGVLSTSFAMLPGERNHAGASVSPAYLVDTMTPKPARRTALADVTPVHHGDAPPVTLADSVLTLGDPEVADMLARLPGDVPVRQHYYHVGSGESGVAESGIDPDTIAYSNTPPTSIYLPPGAGRLIADDVLSVAVGGCDVTGYELVVRRSLGECDGFGTAFCDSDADCPAGQECALWADQSFSVEFAMWDDCPGNVDAQIIPGTEGTIQFPDAGVHAISVTVDPAVTVGQRYWVSTRYSAPGAGWVFGTPAETGFTQNVFHFHVVGFFCTTTGNPAIYAGMSLRTFCELPFEREFVAYANPELDGPAYQPGASTWMADDVQLVTDDCTLSRLEIGAVGDPALPFTIDVEIWQDCNPSTVVEGTQQTKVLMSDGTPKLIRFDYPGGLPLPTGDSFWVAWNFNDFLVPIFAGEATLGFTDNLFGRSEGGECSLAWFGDPDPYAGFTINLRCLGDAPLGACCPATVGESCRETPEFRCSVPHGRWIEQTLCDPDPFDPPCGSFACCLEGRGLAGSCENLFPEECEARGGIVEEGAFCGLEAQDCGWFPCRSATGDCCAAHEGASCGDFACCSTVCDLDFWCCDVAWDAICAVEGCTPCSASRSAASSTGAAQTSLSEDGGSVDGYPVPSGVGSTGSGRHTESEKAQTEHREVPDDLWMPGPLEPPIGIRTDQTTWTRGVFTSVQVNVDVAGLNIPGDAANEPSIAVDPTSPNRIAIGWRQFDTVDSNFRQAGWAYTDNAGQSWTFPGVLEDQVFRSDPVLDADADGNLYYYSLTTQTGSYTCDLFKSVNGGITWDDAVFGYGGDKAWMAIDRTEGIGQGNIYASWTGLYGCCGGNFTRSTDGGASFMENIAVPGSPHWGTISVGPDGELYIASGGFGFVVIRSNSAQDPDSPPVFETTSAVDLGGNLMFHVGPNPGGLGGQAWIATDHSDGSTRGNVYLLASVDPQLTYRLDVMFARSTDGGLTWSEPVRVNDDPTDNGAWQWFGTMSVAPNGRIDAIWNDTRGAGVVNLSELYYSYSTDAGVTWSKNTPVSPVFDSHIGWPNQNNKIGDYYDMVSDNAGVNIAYAATFNGEQDVYFLRIGPRDCNANGVPDEDDVANGTSGDCNGNSVPDECERDCNGNLIPDACDLAGGTSEDCDGNSVPDECEADFDGDGAIDACDPDIDGDDIPNDIDVCDFTPRFELTLPDGRSISDTNGNCGIDLIDYFRFAACLAESGPGAPSPRQICADRFDQGDDLDVDLADFAAFQRAFTGSPP